MHAGRSPAIIEVEKVMLIRAVWLPQTQSAVVVSKFIAGDILYEAIYIKGSIDSPLLCFPSMIYLQPT